MNIEHDIPAPPAHHRGLAAKLRALKPGESILTHYPDTKKSTAAVRRVFAAGTYRSRTTTLGVRIWRIA